MSIPHHPTSLAHAPKEYDILTNPLSGESALAKAQQIAEAELAALGWTVKDLPGRRKNTTRRGEFKTVKKLCSDPAIS